MFRRSPEGQQPNPEKEINPEQSRNFIEKLQDKYHEMTYHENPVIQAKNEALFRTGLNSFITVLDCFPILELASEGADAAKFMSKITGVEWLDLTPKVKSGEVLIPELIDRVSGALSVAITGGLINLPGYLVPTVFQLFRREKLENPNKYNNLFTTLFAKRYVGSYVEKTLDPETGEFVKRRVKGESDFTTIIKGLKEQRKIAKKLKEQEDPSLIEATNTFLDPEDHMTAPDLQPNTNTESPTSPSEKDIIENFEEHINTPNQSLDTNIPESPTNPDKETVIEIPDPRV